MAAIITSLNPYTLLPQQYSEEDISLITTNVESTSFNPTQNYIEYTILAVNSNYKNTFYYYNNYQTPDNTIIDDGSLSSIDINFENDLIQRNLNKGEYNVIYKFLNNELSSSIFSKFYIKSISSDRTEISIATNNLSNFDLETNYNIFKNKLDTSPTFLDFYLNFGDNNLFIANNISLNTNVDQYEILINLYDPLPQDYNINSQLWVVTQVADPIAANILFPVTPIKIIDAVTQIQGPNFNINVKNQTNNSTQLVNYNQLLSSSSIIPQYSQIKNLLQEKSININIDYTDFSNFTHFSSVYTRINNFYNKVSSIENASASLAILNSSAGTSNNIYASGSKAYYTNIINNTISNFDGYEYYLYYNSGSWSWPKSTSTLPYTLYPTGSSQVINWLDNILDSASAYDNSNQDYLYYTIPSYLRDDPRNDNYKIFLDMIGQFFDNIWIYYKDVTNHYDADNRLDYGISKDLVAEALRSFGVKLYQNNFSSEDLYSAFLGYTSSLTTISPTLPISSNSGIEYINNYITASYEASVTPLDDVDKEIYKRLYHNLPYLAKTKGTIPGLRALINCFGIPDTILRISEFGGRDRDTTTYDYFYNRYSHALSTTSGSNSRAYAQIPWAPLVNSVTSSGDGDGEGYVALQYVLEDYVFREGGGGGGGTIPSASLPNSLVFRFKTNGIPSNYNTQSLLIKTDFDEFNTVDNWSIGIFLNYTQSFTVQAPYYSGSGSIPTETPTQGNLFFILKDPNNLSNSVISPSIQLPFFNEGWWSVMLQRDKNVFYETDNTENITYTLYVANKLYDSEEGNTIGFIASSSIEVDGIINPFTINTAWNLYEPYSIYGPGVYLGGYMSGSNYNSQPFSPTSSFDGCFQEFRYYSLPLDSKTFEDYTMNPTSIEGLQLTGVSSSFNILGFRAPLGNELWNYTANGSETPFTSSINNTQNDSAYYISIHPAITASSNLLITASFIYLDTETKFSDYSILYPYNPSANSPEIFYINQNEVYYFDQPIAGIKNRTTSKISTPNLILPSPLSPAISNQTLSQYISIQQNYLSSSLETPNVNSLEVAFSPQNEIDDDIISSLGYFNIGEYIGDPRQVSSSSTTYPDLVNLSNNFFQKYFTSYNLFDYIRLIKYFDNSLFKMIQDFVPARTSLTSGVVIKQHLLERNKYPQPSVEWEELDYSGSIDTAFISGGTGGTFDSLNILSPNQDYPFIISGSGFSVDPETPINYFLESSSFSNITLNNSINNNFAWDPSTGELITYFYGNIKLFASGTNTPGGNTFVLYFSSSQDGTIITSTQASSAWSYITPLISCSYGERFSLWIADGGSGPNIISPQFGLYDIYPYSNQTWEENILTPIGETTILHSTQDEFYNGELPYSDILVSNGELNEVNPFKEQDTLLINYDTYLYKNSVQFPNNINYDITNLSAFLNPNTTPNAGEIYLWYDDSTYNIGAPSINGVQYGWDYYSPRFSVERVKYIKINFIDSNGVNNFTNLSQLQNLTLSLPDGVFTYPVYTIQENNGYFLYSIGPYLPTPQNGEYIGNPNTSSLSGILDYTTVATQSSFTYPNSTLTLLTASLTASINTLNYFDDNTSTYTIGDTPNVAITFKLSGSAGTSTPPGGGANIYLLTTRNIPGSSTVLAPFSSPEYIYSILLLSIPQNTSNESLITLYSTSSLIEGDKFRVAVLTTSGEGITITNLKLTISQSIINFTPSSSLTIFDPYLPQSIFSYDYNDYNPLLDNVEKARTSNIFMDIDYSQNPVTPINQSLIVIGGADRAPVQDSNYSSRAWSNIRYNGCKYNSVTIKTRPIPGNNITSTPRFNPFE